MPYPKDLAGDVLHFTIPGDGGPVTPNQLINGVLTGRTLPQRVLVHSTAGVLGRAASRFPKPPWNFTFLRYVPGYVTVAPLTGSILTGPMSGCYIFRFMNAGVPMVAHVGTANHDTSELSVNAKNAWTALAAGAGVTNAVGGTPLDYFTTPEVTAAMPAGTQLSPKICCFVDGTSMYSMLLAPQPKGMGASSIRVEANWMKVAGVKQMTTQPWASIAAMRTFKITEAEDKVVDRTAFKLG